MKQAQFEVVGSDKELVVIRDVGPWDRYPTVTNDVEGVVQRMKCYLAGRRLEYIDSDGHRDRILVENGQFAGFKAI